MNHRALGLLAMIVSIPLAAGCASSGQLRHPQLAPLSLPAAEPLAEDHFLRDRTRSLTEENLRAVLDAPFFLQEDQRLGVLPVAEGYRPERSLPIPAVPGELTRALDSAGFFQATTEISSDWPAEGDVAGLRELAARYRCGYLLLYRQRFAEESTANVWVLVYPTLIGAVVAPSRTLTTAGVLEATLFDVRTGSLLFTLYERVRGSGQATPSAERGKLEELKMRLLDQAAGKLAEQVVGKVRRLVDARRAMARGPPSS